jgi:DNA-directed RNA polymerase subunit RPC12/RpoP
MEKPIFKYYVVTHMIAISMSTRHTLKYPVSQMIILSPEIEIRIKVYLCARCSHLWERRRKGAEGLPITCPSCNSPYWNTKPKGKSEKKLLPLRFHDTEVLDSNFDEVYGRKK